VINRSPLAACLVIPKSWHVGHGVVKYQGMKRRIGTDAVGFITILKNRDDNAGRRIVVQQAKFSELLANVILRYQNRAIVTAQVMEELIAMAKKFKEAIGRGDNIGLNPDELAFYDALANNEEAVREMGDEILKKIAHEFAESLRQNISVDWLARENVRAKLRLMVKRILRKYKYPPDRQEEAVKLVLEQAETLSAEWA
jgi:type I restriction enzyme, R subunit